MELDIKRVSKSPVQSGTLRQPSGPGTFSPRQAMILTFGYTSKGSPSLSKRCTAITRLEIPTCGPAIPTPSCSLLLAQAALRTGTYH